MGSLNMCIISTHYVAQCSGERPPQFGFKLRVMDSRKRWKFSTFNCCATQYSYGSPFTQPQKQHSQIAWLLTAGMYEMNGLKCSFLYSTGLQLERVIQHNLVRFAHYLLFFHVRTTNQPTVKCEGTLPLKA
jgi:hypothetical protein